MRMLLKAQVPVEAGNDAIASGRIGEILGGLMERLQPEAAYFVGQGGDRGCYIFFDLEDPSQIPVIAEPLFQGLNASVEFTPAMNFEDVQKGLAELQKSSGGGSSG